MHNAKRVCVLVGVVGCAAQPARLDLDIVVAPSYVQVYTNGTDGETGPNLDGDTFPAAGSCAGESDVGTLHPGSCIAELVITDGATQLLDVSPEPGQKSYGVDMTSATAPVLEIVGCGGDGRIPLGATPFVASALSVSAGSDGVTATWSGPPAVELDFDNDFAGARCYVTTSPYTLAGTYEEVHALTLGGPVIVDTPFGEARVWRGGVIGGPIAMP